jgi:hypothetical protein
VPRINYSGDFGGADGAEKFPKITLTKGQKVRIVCPEVPFMEWVHRLEAPQFENGMPLMKRKDGKDPSSPLVWDLKWTGNPLCQGDHEVLKSKGTDPQNCPVCAAAVHCQGIKPPARRYAMNVVQYSMLPNGQPVLPFNVGIIIWAYTEKTYGKLLGFQKEWGDLSRHDLVLGPPEEPAYFQRYPIEISSTAWWTTNSDTQRTMQQAWQAPGQRATDEQLRDACGSLRLQYLADDIQKVVNNWRMAENAGPLQPGMQWAGQPQGQGLQQGFGDILGPQPSQAQPMHPLEAQAAAADPFSAPNPNQPGVGGFGAPPQPAQPQPGFGSPFGQPQAAPQQPVQPSAASPDPFAAPGQALQQAAAPEMNGIGTAFGSGPAPQSAAEAQQRLAQTQQPAGGFSDPFGSVQPQQPAQAAPGGFSEFTQQGTSNPQQAAAQPVQPAWQSAQPATAPQSPAQPSFAPPAPAAPAPGPEPSFDELINATQQQ